LTEQKSASVPTLVRKQQKRSIITQQKLLNAAIDAFSENGFKGTSTRDIADRAGMHHPLISYHFKNKDRLWRAAADKIFGEFKIALVKALSDVPELNPKSRAEAFIRTYVRYSHDQPALHKIIFEESSSPSARLDWLIETHLKPLFEIVVEQLAELQRLGVTPPGNTALLYNMIRASIGGLLALGLELKGTSNIDLESKAGLDELAETIIQVFLPGELPATA